jgi:hypothetical protein
LQGAMVSGQGEGELWGHKKSPKKALKKALWLGLFYYGGVL